MSILTPKQTRAATLLAGGKLCVEVAAAVNVRPQTISRWKSGCEFQALMNGLRAESLDAGIAGLQSLASQATSTVGELLKAGSPPGVRLKAAEVVLAHAGLTDRQSEQWHIGPTTPEGQIKARFQAVKNRGLESSFWKSLDESRALSPTGTGNSIASASLESVNR